VQCRDPESTSETFGPMDWRSTAAINSSPTFLFAPRLGQHDVEILIATFLRPFLEQIVLGQGEGDRDLV